MASFSYNPNNWSVGSKLTAFTFGLVGLIIAALVLTISVTTSSMLEQRAVRSVQNELRSVVDMVDLFNRTGKREAESFGKMFAASYDGPFALDDSRKVKVGERETPALTSGARTVNLDHAEADRFSRQTGGTATVFVASGDDFIRVSTSVKQADGERAVGTVLDHASPAYAALRAGNAFTGLSTVFGKQVMSHYMPLRDAGGRVIGALHAGVDISTDLADLKSKIKAIKVGETGYFYVLDASAGKGYGNLLVHPLKEGANLLSAKAADGREFIKDILSSREGVITYDWMNPGETSPRVKVVAYSHFADWQWVVAAGTYKDEITREATALRIRYIGLGLAALALFAALLYVVVRKTVTLPLGRARDAAMRIAEGDLTVRVPLGRRDEIGLLAESMNGISAKLSQLVGQVREGAEQIASASQQIASGNQDLCVRTERQAANLATTASSMDQLTDTVRQNAVSATRANELAASASGVAQKGGAMVARVIDTMDNIDQSSRKINDIIGMIDSIAFQTNILALNAAVEAARAGEHGRGFAVVASEVRSLAQRSAASAKEIRDLIAASVDQVAAGSKLVKDAGQTMDEVLASVERVTGIMAEISAASEEQRGGIEEVNRSIGEMDAATQQNAALVEEASAAAQSMHELAVQLARGVRLFKIAQQLGNERALAIEQG